MELKKIYTEHIPVKGYTAFTLYPWVFIREDDSMWYTERLNRHEITHAHQQLETLWILFFLIYGIEYLIKLLLTRSHKSAYRSISFEQEAYAHENELFYNDVRSRYAWIKYIFKLAK